MQGSEGWQKYFNFYTEYEEYLGTSAFFLLSRELWIPWKIKIQNTLKASMELKQSPYI